MARVDLNGLPIAITGASSGIGAATAIACARAGMPVVIGARRAEKLRDVADTIARSGGRVEVVEMDVTRQHDCDRLVARAVDAFGSLYAVYANAGYGYEGPIHTMSDADMRAIFETNFFGILNTIRAALPAMTAARRGHILLCSSAMATMTAPYYGAYSATKAAQQHIGNAMNIELAGCGIRVTTVHPIITTTEFRDRIVEGNSGRQTVSLAAGCFTQTSEFVARQTVRVLQRPRPELMPGLAGKLARAGMCLCTALPSLREWAMRGMVKKYDAACERIKAS